MKITIIGAGFGGLSAAAYLAKAGHDVTIYEKNAEPGGRAKTILEQGFQFELGPSWYLMPDVFEEFFKDFGLNRRDFYELTQLIPSYRVYEKTEMFEAHPAPAAFMDFEHKEVGAGARLGKLLRETKREYEQVRSKVLPLSGLSQNEYAQAMSREIMRNPALLNSYHSRIARVVRDPLLQHILEFMVVFLGGAPRNIPAMYGLLTHVDFGLGVYHPMGGFTKVTKAIEQVAKLHGAKIYYNAAVEKLEPGKGITAVINGERIIADAVVANADYHHVETMLLEPEHRMYSEAAWLKKILSPSAVLAVFGVKKRVPLEHHTLFFDADWEQNFKDVFSSHRVNDRPLFYAGAPSRTDPHAAPKDHENIFILIPVGGTADIGQQEAEELVRGAIRRIEQKTGTSFVSDIIVRHVYPPSYFAKNFNAYQNNAFGLAHTMKQSGPFRPPIRSSKVKNLYFTGQFTNPGTGVPLVLLSGKNVARLVG